MNRIIFFIAVSILPLTAYAQFVIDTRSMGARIGSVFPDNNLQSRFALGVEMDVAEALHCLRIVPFIEYSASDAYAGGGAWRVLSSGISALKLIKFRYSTANLFYGGGLGFAYGRFNGRSHSEIDLALHVLTGIRAPLNPQLSITLTAKYMLTGNMNHTGAWLGISGALDNKTN